MAKPTPYRISTITATGSVGTPINLDVLYQCLEVTMKEMKNEDESEGISYIEYGKKKSETIFKGTTKKFLVNRRKARENKRFDNQVTIVYRKGADLNLNIKTFRNGNIQITGIKDIDQGPSVIDIMIRILRDIHDQKENNVIEDVCALKNSNFKIRLINTDFKVGFGVKREFLHRILKNEYEIICDYEPVIYPGVKIHYFYNTANVLKDGKCHCTHKCNDVKGGNGCGDSDCKKITIAVFQSGCIIITGSQTKHQIDECYLFINKVLSTHMDRIEKKIIVPLIQEQSCVPKKIIKISKSKIIYPEF
jgi:TATA-box binding protein (TBP) (component of TFIID and TFIIIB)